MVFLSVCPPQGFAGAFGGSELLRSDAAEDDGPGDEIDRFGEMRGEMRDGGAVEEDVLTRVIMLQAGRRS